MSQTRPVNFIPFHGLDLLVMGYEGVEYVAAKPLTDLAGIHWKTAKQTLLDAENVTLYGTNRIPEPQIAGTRGRRTARTDTLGSAGTPSNGVLCVRLDRARMFLARINTRQMKAQGNVKAAEHLLALQVEWAKVLHDCETKGLAAKPGAMRDLLGLIKARTATTNVRERAALSAMIADTCADLGYPLPADQQCELLVPEPK